MIPTKAIFKVGDKVKIPKEKSIMGSITTSWAIAEANKVGQKFLYINRISSCAGMKAYGVSNIVNGSNDYFLESELEPFVEEEVKVEVVDTEDYKMVIANPYVIYIIKDKKYKRTFKGVAKVMKGDNFDANVGIEIAMAKATIKQKQHILKTYSE